MSAFAKLDNGVQTMTIGTLAFTTISTVVLIRAVNINIDNCPVYLSNLLVISICSCYAVHSLSHCI